MPEDQYHTVQEVADRVKVAQAMVRQYIKTGALLRMDKGKGWRTSDTDIAQFLKSRETAPRPHQGPAEAGRNT